MPMQKVVCAASVLVATTLTPALVPPASGAVLCQKKSGVVVVRAACKKKETALDLAQFGAVGPKGDPGEPGPPGADGQLRIFGNGSAGARTVTSDADLSADINRQYTDLTVASGVTLTIPSGTVIRCTGSFTNSGTIVVGTGSEGGGRQFQLNEIETNQGGSGQGVALSPAGPGGISPAGTTTSGGFPAKGLTAGQARTILHPGVNAGGAGGLGAFGGGRGGGGLTVLAVGPIVNGGTLHADGEDVLSTGGGGGGGGIVILASKERVENSGVITADGGSGGLNTSDGGAGGGGGGGIVHLVAPSIVDSGTISVGGGAAGTLTAVPVVGVHVGGGAGGACGGDGGQGGFVGSNNLPSAAVPGDPGHALQTTADPTALF